MTTKVTAGVVGNSFPIQVANAQDMIGGKCVDGTTIKHELVVRGNHGLVSAS